MEEKKILSRIAELQNVPLQDTATAAGELQLGAITLLAIAHGENSQQVNAFNDRVEAISKSKDSAYQRSVETALFAKGVLANLKSEVEQGLVGSLRREVTGEVLADFVELAKIALAEGTDGSKNVAAVLAAAAFEDTLRRLGELYCNIQTRAPLPDILVSLKTADILKGSQIGVVQSHFQFRNDAMHADWQKIDKVAVGTIIGLVQELLLKHFS